MDELAVMLGGYVAEKLVFDELTTGASDDLQKAADLARNMVTRFGMSEKIGPVVLEEREGMMFLGRDMGGDKNYSEQTAQIVDQEVKKSPSIVKSAQNPNLLKAAKANDLGAAQAAVKAGDRKSTRLNSSH